METFNFTQDEYKEANISLLIDILATNMDILDRLNAIHEFEYPPNYDHNKNRVQIIEYLHVKYGSMKKPLSDILKTKGIDKKK